MSRPSPLHLPEARPARGILLCGLLLAGCSGGEPEPVREGQPWFEEVAASRGLDFQHTTGHEERCLFPEIIAGGGALVDLDADGDLDAYLVQSGHLTPDAPESPPNQLFLNDGSGAFTDFTEESGSGDRGYGMGVVCGDADGDGDVELYVLNLEENVLFENLGDARFRNGSAASGLADPSWSVSGSFFDAENDGDLDLFVVNYIAWSLSSEIECSRAFNKSPDYCSPKQYQAPAPDTFYRNEGNGVFTDVSAEAGLRTSFGNGLGLVCTDFDDDGWTDVFVANDGTPNQLWRNRGDGTFLDEADKRGFAFDQHGFAKAGMGVAAGDVDADGDEDVIVVNQGGETDSFYRNDGGAFLFDSTLQFGLGAATRPFTRFGVALLDFDNDGHLDLYEANGRVERAQQPGGTDPYAEENVLMRGVSDQHFVEVSPRGGTARPLSATSRGAAFGDIDGDGGLDILVINRDGPAHLLRNVIANRGEWLRVNALDGNGSAAVGALVTVVASDRTISRVVRSGYSYAAASDLGVHFGLGDAAAVEEIRVRWPDGSRESFGPSDTGTSVDCRRGAGKVL